MRKNDKQSRMFGFVGFKSEEEAAKAKKFFNGTFLDTSRIAVDFAKLQGDPELPRAWSKFSKGSSAYAALHKNELGDAKANAKKLSQLEKEKKAEEVEKKKDKFRAFLKVIGVTKENKQSWNDNFAAFMADDGSGLVHTSKAETEKKNKRKSKEDEKAKQAEEKKEVTADVKTASAEEELIDEQRLYVMNLPFAITHDELRETFSKYGEIEDIEIPLRRGGQGFGFAFIRFATVEASVSAFAELDKTYY